MISSASPPVFPITSTGQPLKTDLLIAVTTHAKHFYAVLGMVIAEYLFKKYPYKDEGFLTEMRSRLVNREAGNAQASRELRVGRGGPDCQDAAWAQGCFGKREAPRVRCREP